MEKLIPADLFFSSKHPAALDLPHLITAIDAELIGKMLHLTKAKLGLWDVAAPFDENDVYDRTRESMPFSAWALPANQDEVLSFSSVVREAVFGVTLMMTDANCDEAVLARLAVPTVERLETGAHFTHGHQDLPELGEVLAHCGWALIPIGPERGKALFIVGQLNEIWVKMLKEWCHREGRNCGVLREEKGKLVIADSPAPEGSRSNAIAHHVDGLLGELETYFGELDESIGELVGKRVQARRKLQEDIARSKQSGTPG